MRRQELEQALERVWDSYEDVVQAAGELSNEQLEGRVPFFGGREIAVRNMLYMMVTHPREHTVHLTKILQKTGTPGAHPTESLLILGQIAESLGALEGLLARASDADLDQEFEGDSIRRVLEHVASTQQGYSQRIRAYLEGTSAPAAS